MSESDDTDLLLLIPPDFFVIHSDSEDSAESFPKNKSDYRFNELINQVNELEERINFIENKDSNNAESFSKTSRINRSVDYSFSFDASDNHNAQNSDLALRFYSLESTAGFRFECNNDYAIMDCMEPSIMSSLANKVHYPRQNFCPPYDSKSESLANHDSHLKSANHTHAISMEHSSQQITSNNALHSGIHSSSFSNMPAGELNSPYRLSNNSPFNVSFLNEIDEFLENKNKQASKSLYYSVPFDVADQEKVNENELKVAGRSVNDKDEYHHFTKHLSTSPKFFESKQFDVGQVDELTEVDHETNFKHQSSDLNYDVIPCAVDSDVQTSMDNYEQQYHILQNNIEKDVMKESSNSEYLPNFQILNPSKLSKDSLRASLTRVPSEWETQKSVNRQANELGSRPIQPLFNTGSQSSSDVWESEHLRKPTTTVSRGKEDLGGETRKTADQYKNVFSMPRKRSDNSIICDNPLYMPIYKDKLRSTDSYVEGRGSNFTGSSSELSQSKNSLPFNDNSPGPKHSKSITSQDLSSCVNTNVTSCFKASDDKLKNCKVSESRNDSRSKMPPYSLISKDSDDTQKRFRIAMKDIDNCILPSNVVKETHQLQKKSLYVNDEHCGEANFRELTKEHANNQCERNQMQHKLVNDFGKTVGPAVMDDGYYSSAGTGSSAVNLLSLSDLWGKEAKDTLKRETMTVEQKLEEEFCRRKHCENVIQRLQCSTLELQQKLAVAMKVDRSKDLTIQQLQTAWKRLANHWQELEEQRHALSVKLSEEKEKHQQNTIDMIQKVKQCELELSKALDLAKGYKEKSEMMEGKIKEQEISNAQEKKKLQESVEEELKRVMETENNLKVIQNEMKEMKEKLETAENIARDEKESAGKLQEELKDVQHMLGNLEADMSIVKEENISLRLRIKEQRARNDVLDQQMKSLKISLDENKKKEKLLQNELKERADILEKTKTELRDYYQQQVEIVVQEKLIEFQTQLDAAEASLHQEMEQKEKFALETASKQIKHIAEKNLLEVKLLEEKHKEELHLCKLQLTQAIQQINQLQTQLQSYSNRKVEIVEKLHSVMETQWQEALRIISGSSPVEHFQEQQQVVLEKDISDDIPGRDVKLPNDNCNTVPPLLVPHSSSSSTTDEIPFNKEDQLTYRASNEQQCNHKADICSENADVIKKYIEMLLNRSPGNPLDQEVSFHRNSLEEIPVSEGRIFPNWEKFLENQQIVYENGKTFPHCSSEDPKCSHSLNYKSNKHSKPPWK